MYLYLDSELIIYYAKSLFLSRYGVNIKFAMWLVSDILLVLICQLCNVLLVEGGAVCKNHENTTLSSGSHVVILLDGKHSLKENVIQNVDLDQCCDLCNEWTGEQPCAAYAYMMNSQACHLLSRLGPLSPHPNSQITVGYPAIQKYSLVLTDMAPIGFSTIESVQLQTSKPEECGFYCLSNSECRAVKYKPFNNICELGKVTTRGNTAVAEIGTNFYEIDYNLDTQTLQDITPILITGGSIAINNVLSDKIFEFIPEKSEIRLVGTFPLGMGYHYAGVYMNKLVVEGGQQGTPNQGGHSWGASTHADIPFTLSIYSGLGQMRYQGCAHMSNDKLYQCFGRTSETDIGSSACSVYDLTTFTYSQTITTGLPKSYGAACVWDGTTAYVLGGHANGAATNRFYRIDVQNPGAASLLQSFNFAMEHGSAVWFQGGILACGGIMTGASVPVSHCFKYNLLANNWQPFANLVVGLYNHQLVNWADDKVLCIGGNIGGNQPPTNKIYVYDINIDQWTEMSGLSLPVGLQGMHAVNLKHN